MFKVTFERSNGKTVVLGVVSTMYEVNETINKFLKDHNYTSYYQRQWYDKKKKATKVDVGSWSEFFYINEIEGSDVMTKEKDDNVYLCLDDDSMTRDDKIIYLYQNTDLTLEAIGKMFGISRQRVFQIIQKRSNIKKVERKKNVKYDSKQVVYEGLRYWMNLHNVSKADLFKQMNSCPTASLLSSTLRGTKAVTKPIIDDILRITKLDYDFCFKLIQPIDVEASWSISSDGYFPYCSNCSYEPYKEVVTFNVNLEDMILCPNCGAHMIVKNKSN